VIRIAIDAMGGDHAPAAPVAGAVLARATLAADTVVQLVGQTAVVEAELTKQGVSRDRIEIVEAPEAVGMAEKPVEAVRSKRNSSIALGLGLQKAGHSDAFVSAGNTGAVMAAATLILRLYPGFNRPAIGAPFPTADHTVLLLDAGANVDCTPQEIVGFAHLGTHYSRDVLGRPDPVVGLLSIGEESEKGNAAVKEAHKLLAADPALRFCGNVEGRDILMGHSEHGVVDVIVSDGFTGNVLLKFYESVGRLLRNLVGKELSPEVQQSEGMRNIAHFLDYARFGGAPLLGVRGVCIIAHGRSSPEAFASAIRVAAEAARHHLVQHMNSEFVREGAAS